jgi:hypothetical protein
MDIHAKNPREYVDNVYTVQEQIQFLCGLPLQQLLQQATWRNHYLKQPKYYHCYMWQAAKTFAQHCIIVIAYVSAPLQLDACMGTEKSRH